MEDEKIANFTFGKEYKLCRKKVIEEIFKDKLNVKSYPYLLYYKEEKLDTERSFQIVISVPKRNIRKAHDRNRIKRLTKEVFRMNKFILEERIPNDRQYAFYLIYSHKEEMDYNILNGKIKKLFEKFIEKTIIENETKL